MNVESVEQIRILGSSLSVLYAEDDKYIREQVHSMLKRIFNNIDLAVDGQEALTEYYQKEYDLILTDIEMPRMDGVTLCKKIIEDSPEQVIIMISAHKEVEQLIELMNIGISGLILKSINIDSFIQKLHIKVKEIYANKMMKLSYQNMQKQIDSTNKSHEELQKKDSLTSVYNYKYLQKRIKSSSIQTAMLFNINDFKLINEHYSHNHANHLLFHLASMLMRESKKYDCDVFRISGDEFLLLYNNENIQYQQVKDDIEKILNVVNSSIFNIVGVKDVQISIRASYASAKTRLLEELNIALDYGKKYKQNIVGYGECINYHNNVQNIIEMKNILKNAVENRLVVPVYQPIFMLNNDVKYEVLMRIKQGSDELLTPDKFLEIAKDYGFYNEISEILIFKALENILNLNTTFSINISFMDIENSQFIDRLEAKLLEYGVSNKVIFEIVESDFMDDMNIVYSFIKRFKALGVRIAIDDFGSGYSNFTYIFKFEPDYLKLDGSLVENILNDRNVEVLVKSIINLAHELDIKVIAEYVSSKELYDVLTSFGVDAMQGFYLGYPQKDVSNVTKKCIA